MARGFVAAFAGYEAVVTPSASCAAIGPAQHSPVAGAAGGDRAWPAAVAEVAPRTYELSEFLTDVLGVTDVGAYFPHRVTYHPTCHSLRMLRVGDAAAAAAARGPRPRPGRAAGRRGVLRVRRHVRAEERRHLGGDAARTRCATSARPGPRSCRGATTPA